VSYCAPRRPRKPAGQGVEIFPDVSIFQDVRITEIRQSFSYKLQAVADMAQGGCATEFTVSQGPQERNSPRRLALSQACNPGYICLRRLSRRAIRLALAVSPVISQRPLGPAPIPGRAHPASAWTTSNAKACWGISIAAGSRSTAFPCIAEVLHTGSAREHSSRTGLCA
jgi:hypothetical protein